MTQGPLEEMDTKATAPTQEEFEKLAGLAESYAVSAEKILADTDHPLNSSVKAAINSSIFAVPIYEERQGYGITRYGNKSAEEKHCSVGVAIVDQDLHPEWFESTFAGVNLVAIYKEEYRTVFIRADADFSDTTKGLVFIHEFFHGIKHQERHYAEIGLSDPRHAEEEVEAVEYEIDLAKQILPDFSTVLTKLVAKMQKQVKFEGRSINFSEFDQAIIDSLTAHSESEKKIMGTLIRCGAVFAILDQHFGKDSWRVKADYIEQHGYGDLETISQR